MEYTTFVGFFSGVFEGIFVVTENGSFTDWTFGHEDFVKVRIFVSFGGVVVPFWLDFFFWNGRIL